MSSLSSHVGTKLAEIRNRLRQMNRLQQAGRKEETVGTLKQSIILEIIHLFSVLTSGEPKERIEKPSNEQINACLASKLKDGSTQQAALADILTDIEKDPSLNKALTAGLVEMKPQIEERPALTALCKTRFDAFSKTQAKQQSKTPRVDTKPQGETPKTNKFDDWAGLDEHYARFAEEERKKRADTRHENIIKEHFGNLGNPFEKRFSAAKAAHDRANAWLDDPSLLKNDAWLKEPIRPSFNFFTNINDLPKKHINPKQAVTLASNLSQTLTNNALPLLVTFHNIAMAQQAFNLIFNAMNKLLQQTQMQVNNGSADKPIPTRLISCSA